MSRNAFRIGRELIYQKQKELKRPPKRSKINRIVKQIVKEADLKHDVRLHSFVLLATCALLGRESTHCYYRRRK